MKSFLRKIVLFFIVTSIFITLLVFLLIFLNTRNFNACNLPADTNAVILGDSHMMWSINDSSIQHLRNISLNAEGYMYTYAKLKYLLENRPDIKTVYLGVSYHNFSAYYNEYIYGNIFRHFIHRYLGILSVNDYFVILKNNPRLIIELYKNIIQKGSDALIYKECSLYGTFPVEKMTETFDEKSMKKRIQDQFYKNSKVIGTSELNIKYLIKIVELCKNRNIRLIALGSPLQHEYYELIPAKFKDIYKDFISNNELPNYNFSDLELADSCYLPDADHVNYYGALLTSKKFKEYHENNQ